jgi:hypothetical protein
LTFVNDAETLDGEVMFYCEECRVRNEWPHAFGQSYGMCEMCDKTALCWDRPSSSLPKPKPKRRIKLNKGGWYLVFITEHSLMGRSRLFRNLPYATVLGSTGGQNCVDHFSDLCFDYVETPNGCSIAGESLLSEGGKGSEVVK